MEARERDLDWQAELAAVAPFFVAAMLTAEGKQPPEFEQFVLRARKRKRG